MYNYYLVCFDGEGQGASSTISDIENESSAVPLLVRKNKVVLITLLLRKTRKAAPKLKTSVKRHWKTTKLVRIVGPRFEEREVLWKDACTWCSLSAEGIHLFRK